MTQSIRDQAGWQHDVIATAGFDPAGFVGVEFTWWKNPLNTHSLRLTAVGHKWFATTARQRFYQIDLIEKILPRHLLQLERLVHSPYYIKSSQTLYVLSEQDAIMLQLHGGDLATYLDNLAANS